jgi:hypothetical protein
MPITVRPSLRLAASMFALLAALVLALAWSPAAHANRRIRAGSCDIFCIDQTDPIAFSAHKELFGYLLVDLALGDVGLTPMHRTGAIGPVLCEILHANFREFQTYANFLGLRQARHWPFGRVTHRIG